MLSLVIPWIFPFIIPRALLPLNTGPLKSILLTFGLMGISGWALQARAAGLTGRRIALVHAWPHPRAMALAQFRVLAPARSGPAQTT